MNIEESLNKGVPVGTLVSIRQADLTKVIPDEKLKRKLNENFRKYMDYIGSIVPETDIEYFGTLAVLIDENTLERRLIFSPQALFSTLAYNLNYKNTCYNQSGESTEILATKEQDKKSQVLDIVPSFKRPLYQRINRLLDIKTPQELQLEFPFLYPKYFEQCQIATLQQELSKLNRNERRKFIKKLPRDQQIILETAGILDINKKPCTSSLAAFTAQYAHSFKEMIEHSKDICNYALTHPINLGNIKESNRRKLDLYFASEYLKTARNESYEEDKQDYLYYVANYFAENKDLLDSDLSIEVGTTDGLYCSELFDKPNKKVITPRSLYREYQQLLVENPNLRDINFSNLNFEGMSAKEVSDFMHEYMKDLDANWEILPPDDKSYEQEVITKIKGSGKQLTEEEKQLHQERLLEIFMEKKELYDSSDPFFRIKGKGSFDGYIGYIYKNGHVVLDKFFEDSDNGKLADGQAIYAMNIDQFYELSRLSKSEIIKNKLCRRYIHRGNWQDRVLQNEILAEAGINPSEDVKQLIKTGKINPIEEKPTEDSSNK